MRDRSWTAARISFGGGQERIEIPVCNQYTIQGDLFSKAILDKTDVPEPLEDAVRNMECIEAVFRSAGQGGGKARGR